MRSRHAGLSLFEMVVREAKPYALLERAGKDYCKPTPRCSACPLDPLPHRTDINCG